MEYKAAKLETSCAENFAQDVLVAMLGDLGFESFETEEHLVTAYIPAKDLDEGALRRLVEDFPYAGVRLREVVTMPDVDWNAEWEKNYFQPIVIDELCVIHAPFHKEVPQMPYDIIIEPKMAFGTGHHQTTHQMVSAIGAADMQNKHVLDMGCGTGILAMMAWKCGARDVVAVDIDQWCVDNTKDNLRLNRIPEASLTSYTSGTSDASGIAVMQGDGRLLTKMAEEGRQFDVVLANINRNILLMDMDKYVALLEKGGRLLMSGFYTEDVPMLMEKARNLGCELQKQTSLDNWAMIEMLKN